MRNVCRNAVHTATAGVALSAVVLALTGCVASAPSPHPSSVEAVRSAPPTVTTTPTPTPTTTTALDPLIGSEGHISATGAEGALRVGIVPADDTFQVSITGYRPASAEPRRLVLTTVASGADCSTALQVDTGTLTSATSQTFTRPYPWDNVYEDLSEFTAAVLVPADVSRQEACAGGDDTVVSLTWSVPDALAQLAVADHGGRYGAHGRVVLRAGKPLRYAVASGDLLDDVASRFGLTPDELLWLTPSRARGQDGLLYVGDELNLDPADRGLFT